MKPQSPSPTSAAQALPVQTQIVTTGTEVSGALPFLAPPPGAHETTLPRCLARGRRRRGCDGGVAAPGDAHIYSELPASVRSERGLPRESGLVLRSPECPSGGKVPTLTWPFLSCLSHQLAHGPAHTSSIHVFILHIHTYIMCVPTWLWDSTDE
uniref:Leucine rich repeat containing 29 n=1 Tax=Myotis myotis TaxID=51298 RepID=A0A7J7SCZ6_MYOMY|nr:leucine rich repeat containing 29 [Myotis myotis]